jgi:hypothetical protein
MNRMVQRFLACIAFASSIAIAPAHAASGYDLSDMWKHPLESGWGITLVQQDDVIFATLFVHRPDGSPAWYTAALRFLGLEAQTHEMSYSGELYETRGTWFGSLPFSNAGNRLVGTMSVVAPTMTTATLTYSVDGTTATKQIERFTFRNDDYNGIYVGAHSVTSTKCSNPADDGTRTAPTSYTISLTGNQMTILTSDNARTCSYSGTYRQEGRLGRVDSTYSCSNGDVGAMSFEEMNIQRFAVMGRLFGANNRGCHLAGSFAGVVP